jgi:hypothetical protein
VAEETGPEDIRPTEPFIPYTDRPRLGFCRVRPAHMARVWTVTNPAFAGDYCAPHLRELVNRATWGKR